MRCAVHGKNWSGKVRAEPATANRAPGGTGGLFSRVVLAGVMALAALAGAQDRPTTPPRVITVAMDDNYPPFVFKDAKGNLQGITIDQWHLWETKTGIKAEIHAMDWGEALRRMQAGEFDVIDTVFKTDARRVIFDFAQPYARLEVHLYFRQGISGITDLASLRGFPVAAKTGDAVVDQLRQSGVASVLLFGSYQAIITAALENKVNVFAMDRPPALFLLNQQGLAAVFRESAPVGTGEFHRAVRKGNAALLGEVERGFAAFSPQELRQIDEKWHGQPLEKASNARRLGYAATILIGLAALLAGWVWFLRREVRRRTVELRQSESLFRTIFEQAPLGIAEGEMATAKTISMNQRYADILGYPIEELLALTFQDFTLPDDLAKELPEFQKLAAGEIRTYAMEKRFRRKDGTIIWANLMVSSLARPGEKPRRCMAVIDDITARKDAEAALQQSEGRFRRIMESGMLGMIFWSAAGEITGANDAFLRTVGYSREDLASGELNWKNLSPPEYQAQDAAAVQAVATTGACAPYEKEYFHRDGSRVPILIGGASLPGEPLHGVAFVLDISARKRTEAKMETQLAELQRWNQVTLGREDRVRELKAEINALLAAQGQPPRYGSVAEP